jgi:hypothetical protein
MAFASTAQTKDELLALSGPVASQARALYEPKGDASLKAPIQAVIADRSMLKLPAISRSW